MARRRVRANPLSVYRKTQSRESLLREAKWLKLTLPLAISDEELEIKIFNSPMTPKQREYIEKLAAKYGLEFPGKRTYGQIKAALELERDLNNQYSIDCLGLEEGRCFKKDGQYFQIVNILSSREEHRMWLEKVTLSRPDETQPAVATPTGDKRQRTNPHEIIFHCDMIDLATWGLEPEPEYNYWPSSSSPDDPPF